MACGGERTGKALQLKAKSGFPSLAGFFYLPLRAGATRSPCSWSSREPHASSFLSSSATGWFSLPGPLSLPSVSSSSTQPTCHPFPGAGSRYCCCEVWGSRLGLAPEPRQLLPALHFGKANLFTRILTPGALYYWSSYLGHLFYINKEMSKNCWQW